MYPPKAKKPVSHWIMSHFLGPLVFFRTPPFIQKTLGRFPPSHPGYLHPGAHDSGEAFFKDWWKAWQGWTPHQATHGELRKYPLPLRHPGGLKISYSFFFGTSNLEYPKEARHEQRKYNKCLLFAIQIHIFAEIRIIYNKVHIQNKEEPPPPPFSFAVFTCFYNLSQTKI